MEIRRTSDKEVADCVDTICKAGKLSGMSCSREDAKARVLRAFESKKLPKIFSVISDNKVVGCLFVWRWNYNQEKLMASLYLKKSFKNQSLAKLIDELLMGIAKENRTRKLSLSVNNQDAWLEEMLKPLLFMEESHHLVMKKKVRPNDIYANISHNGFKVVKVKTADASRYLECYREAAKASEVPMDIWSLDNLKTALTRRKEHFLAIKDHSGKFIACGEYKIDDGNLYLHNVLVIQEFRRKGLASTLITEMFRNALDKNATNTITELNSNNKPSYSLLSKLGFKEKRRPWTSFQKIVNN